MKRLTAVLTCNKWCSSSHCIKFQTFIYSSSLIISSSFIIFAGLPLIRCYKHGQSNQTYLVQYPGRNMVLRKQPSGPILPSAHAVDREYKVMSALGGQGVPVPKMISCCDDPRYYLNVLMTIRVHSNPWPTPLLYILLT